MGRQSFFTPNDFANANKTRTIAIKVAEMLTILATSIISVLA